MFYWSCFIKSSWMAHLSCVSLVRGDIRPRLPPLRCSGGVMRSSEVGVSTCDILRVVYYLITDINDTRGACVSDAAMFP